MDDQSPARAFIGSAPAETAIASELNNLLQVIASTSAKLETICDGITDAGDYLAMLRASTARAAEVTTQLVELSGSMNGKVVLHPAFPRPRQTPLKKESSPKRILVVDDEKMLLILASELLREAGYDVVTAQSGFECLDLFRASARSFDLVLLDLSMPLMNGEETFNRLRALRPDVRVMLCTGYVHQTRLQHMLEAGLAGFQQKPIGSKEYIASVRAALTGATLLELGASCQIGAAV